MSRPSKTRNRGLRLDPRTKLFLLLACALAVLLSPSHWYELGLMAAVATLTAALGRPGIATLLAAGYATLIGVSVLAQPLDLGIFTTTVVSFLVMLRKVLPCALLGAGVVATTHVNELMAAFSRMRVPRAVTIPLAVMMRYLPAIREDWQHLRDAMRMRGISLGPSGFLRHPALTAECLYVPLMMSASILADELSMAAVARGIENPAHRTCYTHIELRAIDVVLMTAGALAVLVALALPMAGLPGGVG